MSEAPADAFISLDSASELTARIQVSSRFGVNALSHDQPAIARTFTRKDSDKFAGKRWTPDRGLPRLDGTASWLGCSAARLVEGGDHIYFG